MLRLPRYTGFEISGSPNHTIEWASHGELLHRRFDGLNGMALAGTPRSQKKVVGGLYHRALILGCPRLVGFRVYRCDSGKKWERKTKQRRAQQLTTTNPYHSFPLQSFEQFIKKVFEFVTFSFGYTFLHSFSSFSKLFWTWKIVIKLLSWQMVRRSVLV